MEYSTPNGKRGMSAGGVDYELGSIYDRLHKLTDTRKARGKRYSLVTIMMILIGLAWLPVIQNAKGLYDYLQGVQGYLAPPIFVVFFCGVFHKRLNAKGCLAALVVGFALGVFRLAVDTPVSLMGKEYAEGSFFWIVNHIYFQYYSMFITLVCIVIMYAVSYATKVPDHQQIKGLAFGTISEEEKAKSRGSWSFLDVAGSVVLVLCIIAAYLYFSTLLGAKPF